MAFSALLDSFNLDGAKDRRKHPSSPLPNPTRKRQKLCDTTDTAGADHAPDAASKDLAEASANGYIAALAAYRRHYDGDNRLAEPVAAPTTTIAHPTLGRVTVSGNIGTLDVPEPKDVAPLDQYISNYADVVYAGPSNRTRDSHRKLVCSHVYRHLSITRQLVLKNNEKISKRTDRTPEGPEQRDQGFTRPKILFILPTRNSCYELVNIIVHLAGRESQENKARFVEEFGPGAREKPFPIHKPEDFKQLFHGNSDDMFRIGIKFTRKSIKFFSKFYHSDIIMASPLGLKTAIGDTEHEPGNADFLSSIEVLYVEGTDALLMQNWDHVESIFANLNQVPTESHGCDFSRVRNWYLDGNASSFRQTILSTGFLSPEINSVISRYCRNHAGFIKFHDTCSGELSSHIQQVFTKLPSPSPLDDPNIRFHHFTNIVLPQWKDNGIISQGGILIFLSSYLDFVRVRNHFVKTGESVGGISEYTSAAGVARARAYFLSGRHKILLYTERAHHFRRYSIKGVFNVFMYNMPANPVFYGELMAFLRESITNSRAVIEGSRLRALFTQWDALKVERIVGTTGYDSMRRGSGSMDFEFP
ncbi:hypothetical protein DRE_05052 [Drechslerella stenobrocha 248]|uniref:U3 small nucleolar RNA-associated protein 25 n=1 Tax=Drechslerella stenobrocha 248 TaxID=1043628 RepID=W7I9K5_9PEZI|nr:hypothetical protein DRE_05052 [Drechslerella stenobrocha 248]